MPNHYEFNADSFDELLTGEDNSVSSPENDSPVTADTINDSPVTADTIGGENLLSHSSNDSDPVEPKESDQDKNIETSNNSDFLTSFLSEYGLKDGKVTYENDDGTTEEVDFDSLDSEEKINILKELTSPNLSKDEIAVINYLRSNNATIQDVITYYSQKAVEDYIKENGPIEKQYSVDEYSDDELYIADLKSKFSDMSEDDIKTDLEIAKENEELFKKKVDIIRKQYKAQEEETAKERIKEQEEQFNNFKTSLESQLNDFNSIPMDYKDNKSDSLQIEESEKEEIYKYILNQDENGATQFFKDLNDPKTLVELAWFALYGKEAISDITNYWKSQLKNTRKSVDNKPQTTVVSLDKNKTKDNFTNRHKSVETEYGEDLL